MTYLNFSNENYKNKALNIQATTEQENSLAEAFLLLIKDIKKEDLDNLCKKIQNYYISLPSPIKLSLEDCYNLTQNDNLSDVEKETIVMLAEECIKSGQHLGSNTINDGKINTSSWISHSFFASEVCSILAYHLGLDMDKAKIAGLLHDFGRKFNHNFNHTIEGFEYLYNLGWINEAIGCLTHSFVCGGRCSNNEPALDGFYLDDAGNAKWKDGTNKDDMTLFLENYKYTIYDILLNIADLMSTDKGILSPKDRLADIATRRVIDPTNRGYFLASFTNILIDILKKLNKIDENVKYIRADKNTSLEEIQNYFEKISDYFFNIYINLPKKENQNKLY